MYFQKNQLLIETSYSFYKSTITFKQCIEFALNNKHKHVFITESEHIKFFIQFYDLALKHSLIPICGLKVFWQNSEFLLLAKNTEGYKNLLKISSGKDLSEEILKDIITIHLDGEILFENINDFYIANSECEKGIYIRKNRLYTSKDYETLCILTAIKENCSLEIAKEHLKHQQSDYLIQEDNLQFSWEQNLTKILDSLEMYDLFSTQDFLNFFSEEESKKKIQEMIQNSTKLKNIKNIQLYKERIKYEFQVIKQKKYINYFLIVVDFVNYLKNQNILVGIGRGSVCGSLIAYLIGITEIDPIEYGLYFERFLNSNRNEPPDIDIDIDSSKRNILLEYLINKYGENNVALLSILQRYKYKNAIKDCSIVLGIDPEKLSNIINECRCKKDWDKEMLKNKHLFDAEIEKLVLRSLNLLEVPKGLTVSPSGVIISSENLTNYLPMIVSSERIKTTFFTLSQIEKIGFIKFDILSLVMLEFMGQIIQKITQEKIQINSLNWDDQGAYSELISKNVSGIFQVEGDSISDLINKFKPKNILDLANCISLVRPGSFNYIQDFLYNKNNPNKIKYILPDLEPILRFTHGIPIYQEQIMEIVSTLTGCSFADADTYRKAIAKKDQALLKSLKEGFLEKGKLKNYEEKKLEQIWEYIEKFGSFGFNKSHAIAYAKITYQNAWLKNKYPIEFYSTLLSVLGTETKYIKEIQKKGYQIKFPSFSKTNPTQTCIYIDFKKLPYKYLELWTKADAYMSINKNLIENIMTLIKNKFTKNCILSLNEVGYFDSLFKDLESNDFIQDNMDEFFNIFTYYSDEDGGYLLKKLKYSDENSILQNKENWTKLQQTIYGINL